MKNNKGQPINTKKNLNTVGVLFSVTILATQETDEGIVQDQSELMFALPANSDSQVDMYREGIDQVSKMYTDGTFAGLSSVVIPSIS